MNNLPAWINYSDLKKLFTILTKSGQARLVGGCVRDVVLGRVSTDIDIATTHGPQEVMSLLENAGIKCIPTGLKHGTVTAVLNEKNYEITTLRKDVETFGRHASVEFTNSWEEDAKRRDFTINAMSMDLDGTLYDYYSGQADLKNKLIKFVGNPEERIKEDYLRVLRYFRFISYFGVEHIHQESLNACAKLAEGITQLSGERLRVEILKIASSQYIKEAFQLMDKLEITKHLLIKKLSDKYLDYTFSDDKYVNLAAILRCSEGISQSYTPFQARLRFSNNEGHLLHRLILQESIELSGDENYQKRQIYIHGVDLYKKLLMLANIENPDLDRYNRYKTLANTWAAPIFIINGEDLKKIGYNGAEIGKRLNSLHSMWIESNFELTKEQLLKRI